MLRLLVSQGLQTLGVLFGVATLVFLLFYILPGDPARMMLDQHEDSEQLAAIRKQYAFDQPAHKQYFLYLNDLSPLSIHSTDPADYSFLAEKYTAVPLLQGHAYVLALKWPYLRESFRKTGKPVMEVIANTLPNTLVLATAAISLAISLGLFLGVLSAVWVNTWFDKLLTFISVLGMAVPSFFSAILVAWLFGFVLHKYTGLSMTGSLYVVDDFGEGEVLSLRNLLLPALTLGVRPLAVIMQLTRSSLLEVLSQDYIRTAVAKGLSFTRVLWRHALRNALNPVVTAVSGWFASLLAGAVFVEYIFAWNGMGKELVEALNTMDLPVVMGCVLVIALMFVVINMFVDMIYRVLDPRIRLSTK